VITLGPPSESCELTRLRSASKNLQNSPTVRCIRHIYTYTCTHTCIYISDGRTIEILVPPATFAISVPLPFSPPLVCTFVCTCVRVCIRVCLLQYSLRPIFFRRILHCSTMYGFPRGCVSCLNVFQLPCRFPIDESTSCRFRGPVGPPPATLHAVDVDLKVGRFLVSLIPEKSMRAIKISRQVRVRSKIYEKLIKLNLITARQCPLTSNRR